MDLRGAIEVTAPPFELRAFWKDVRLNLAFRIALGLVLLSLVHATASLAAAGIVKTDNGSVAGVVEPGIVVFKGIPFAAPPLGSLRWKAPQRARAWRGVLSADTFKPQCMQSWPPLPSMPVEAISEDCLYLNLWAPAAPSNKRRAVMVYLYGGGFRAGSASTPLYWGDELARHKDVIVVNLAYRVGPLGFLVHPELSSESPHRVSGNYALLDMIAGLQWVKRNIAAFGGDPGNVTLIGHSAGAWGVNKLMISPLARGLFQRAIAQSGADMGRAGTANGSALIEEAEKSGVAFATSLGARNLADLRKLSAEVVTKASFAGVPGIPRSDAAVPIVDGYVIPADPYSLYAAGKQVQIPLLLGYNSDETRREAKRVTATEFVEQIRTDYSPMAGEFLALYPASTDDEASFSNVRLTSESVYGWQVWTWARLHSRTSNKEVWLYYFDGQITGHGQELPSVFGRPFSEKWKWGGLPLAETITAYWTNFAKTGNPNGEALPEWPAFRETEDSTMFLGKKVEAGHTPDLPEHHLMERFMRR